MSEWWNTREPRERLLLAVLGVLVGVFALVFGAVLPVLDARDSSQQALRRAQADYSIVARTLPALGAGDTAARTPFSRSAVLDAARAQGLQVTRIEAGGGGELSVWIDDAQTTAVFAMFDQLLRDTTAQLERASVSTDANGRLSVQFSMR